MSITSFLLAIVVLSIPLIGGGLLAYWYWKAYYGKPATLRERLRADTPNPVGQPLAALIAKLGNPTGVHGISETEALFTWRDNTFYLAVRVADRAGVPTAISIQSAVVR